MWIWGSMSCSFWSTGSDALWASGLNTRFWMGDTTAATTSTFREIALPMGCRIAQVFANPICSVPRSFLLCEDGRLFAAGDNRGGSLCLPFTEVTLPAGKALKAVSPGIQFFTILLMTDGSLYGCGEVLFASLSRSACIPEFHAFGTILGSPQTTTPTLIAPGLPAGRTVAQVCAMHDATVLLLDNGDLYGAGTNAGGRLGLGTSTPGAAAFTQIALPTGRTATAISCAWEDLAAILDDGSLATCGYSPYLGDGSTTDRFTLATVALPGAGRRAASIKHSGDTFFVTVPSFSTTPPRFDSELGFGTTSPSTNPLRVLTDIPLPTGATTAWFAPGDFTTFVYTTAGRLLMAGIPFLVQVHQPLSCFPLSSTIPLPVRKHARHAQWDDTVFGSSSTSPCRASLFQVPVRKHARHAQWDNTGQLFLTTPGDRWTLTESDILTPQRGKLQGVAPSGSGTLAWGLAAPSLTGVSPATTYPGSSATLTLTGTHFRPEAAAPVTVTVGGLPCANLVVGAGATSLQCTIDPALPLGSHDVVVTNTDIGLGATLTNAFTVVCFGVSSLSAAVGRPGEVITVAGCGFTATCRVQLGTGGALLATTFLSAASSLRFVVPAQPSAASITYEVFVTETAAGAQSPPTGVLFSYARGDALWASGQNTMFWMGDTSTATGFREIALPGGCRIAHLFTHPSYARSFLHCDDGRLFAAGDNYGGSLCVGTTTNSPWTEVTLPPGKALKAVTGSGLDTILHMTDGSLYGCGSSTYGEVLFAPCPLVAIALACPVYLSFSAVLTRAPWMGLGWNLNGRVGLGPTASSGIPFTKLTLPSGRTATTIGCSLYNLAAILDDGSLATCGLGYFGATGDGITTDHYTLTRVSLPGTGRRVASLHFSPYSLVVRSMEGIISGTGLNYYGQLGLGTASATPLTALTDIPIPGGATAAWLACAKTTTFVYTTNGCLLAAGDNSVRGLFLTTTGDQHVLTESDLLTPQRGMLQGVAATEFGTLAWGLAAPSLTGVSPATTYPGSSATLTLTGTHFRPEAAAPVTVTVGGLPCANLVVGAGATSLQCTTDPVLPSGSHDVVVTNTDSGLGATMTSAFTVLCFHISSLSATVGRPGDVITATGCGFTATCRVQLGATGALLATTFLSATSLRFVVPAQPSAATVTYEVFVTETTTGDQSPSSGAASFSYAHGDALWARGRNDHSWMGDASTETAFREIALPAGCRIAHVFAIPDQPRSFLHCVDGRLFAAGTNSYGELCLGTTTDAPFTEVPFPDGKALKAVAVGAAATILHMADGSLYGCGLSNHGEVLVAPPVARFPICVDAAPSCVVARLVPFSLYSHCDIFLSCGINVDRALPSMSRLARLTSHFRSTIWGVPVFRVSGLTPTSSCVQGSNWDGRLGLGASFSDVTAFTQIALPAGRTATAIGCGYWHLAAILDDGSVATCGDGAHGALGHGTIADQVTLTTVALPGTGRRAASLQISSGTLFSIRPGEHQPQPHHPADGPPAPGGATVAWFVSDPWNHFVYTTDGRLLATGLGGDGQLFMAAPGDLAVLTESDQITPQRGMLQGIVPYSYGTLAWGLSGLMSPAPIDAVLLFLDRAAPSLTGVSPATADPGSSATLTLTGTHFRQEATVVTVGGLPCVSLVVGAGATSLQCTTDPALPLGSHDVVVTNTDIGLGATMTSAFTVSCFRVSSLSATVGRPGDVITVAGCGLTATCQVQLGTGGALLATTFISATSLRFVVPAQPSAATVSYEVFVTETATGMQAPVNFTFHLLHVPICTFLVYFPAEGDALWATGQNTNSWMGDTSTETAFREVALPPGCRIAQVFKNPKYPWSFLHCVDGRLFAAGYNDQGQLCLGTTATSGSLTEVTLPAGRTLKAVAPGDGFTILHMTDGSLYGCGDSSHGEVPFASSRTPRLLRAASGPWDFCLPALLSPSLGWICLALEQMICLTLTSLLVVFTQLGMPPLGSPQLTPLLLATGLPAGRTVVQVCAMDRASALLLDNGDVYGAGSNQNGRPGLGPTVTTGVTAFTQVALPTGRTATAIACTSANLAVILDDGSLATCGLGSVGFAGDGTTADRYTLGTVPLPGTGRRAASIQVSARTLFVRSTEGAIFGVGFATTVSWAWGREHQPVTVLTDIPGDADNQLFLTTSTDQAALIESDQLTPRLGMLQGVAAYTFGTLAWGLAAPLLTAVSPATTCAGSSATLTLTGAHFRHEAAAPVVVAVGGLPCANLVVANATCLQCTTDPALPLGSHDVVVTNTDIGLNATMASAFTVCIHVSSLSVTLGRPGDVITVTGCGLTATCKSAGCLPLGGGAYRVAVVVFGSGFRVTVTHRSLRIWCSRVRLGTGGALLTPTDLSATSLRFVVPAQPSPATVTYEVFVTETATGDQSPSSGAAMFSYPLTGTGIAPLTSRKYTACSLPADRLTPSPPAHPRAATVSGLSVLHGPAGSTTIVTVTGTNFAGGAAVRLGTGAAHIDVTPSGGTPSSSSLTFVVPTQPSAESQLGSRHSGQWAVAVVNPASAGSGLSAETGPGLTFSYEPVVTGVSPVWIARTAASTSVTVTGRNLYSGAAVHLAVAGVGSGGSGTAPPGGDITPTSIAPSEDALTFDLPAPASGVADLLEVHVSMPPALMGGTGGAVVYSPQTAATIQCPFAIPVIPHAHVTVYTPPAVASVSGATSNAHSPLLAKVGDQVTVTFTANVALDDTSPSALPVVTLAGRGAAVTFTTGAGATTFTAVLAMASGDAQGNLTFALSGMRDPQGNPQTEATITGTLDVVFDSVAPQLTAVTGASSSGVAGFARVGDQVTLTLQADEALDDAAATLLPGVMLAGRAAVVQLVGPATVRATVTLRVGDPLGPIGYTLSGSLCDLAGNCNSSLAPASGLIGIIFAEASAARSNLTFAHQATAGTWQPVLIMASDPDGNPVPCTATCAGTAFALELSSVQAGLGAVGVPLAAEWSCLGTDFLANYSAPLVAAPDYTLWCSDLLGPRERAPWGLVVTPDSISAGHCNMTVPAGTVGPTVGVPCTSTITARDRWGNHVPCTNANANATFVLLLDEAAPANLTWTCTGGGDFAGTFTPMAPFGHTLKGATRASGEPVGEEAAITVEPDEAPLLIISHRLWVVFPHLAPVDGAQSVFSTNSTIIIVAGHLFAVSVVARDAYGRSDVVCTAASANATFALLWDGCAPEELSWGCRATAMGAGGPVWVGTFRPVVAGPHLLAVVALSDGAFLTGGGTQPSNLTVTVIEGPMAATQTALAIVGGGSSGGMLSVGIPITLGLTAHDAWRNPIGCTNDTASRLEATVDGSSGGGPVLNLTWHCSSDGATFVSSAWTPSRSEAGRRTIAVLLHGGPSVAVEEVVASVNVTIAGVPTASDSTFTLSPSSPLAAGSQLRVIIRARDPAGTEFGCTPETANTTFAVLLDGNVAPGVADDDGAVMWACSVGEEPASFVAVLTVPTSAGAHNVSVTLDGRAIGGSATGQTIVVAAAVISAPQSSFVAPASTPAGASFTVTITARDGAGNVLPCSGPTAASTFRLLWDGAPVASGLSWSCTGSNPATATFAATFVPTAAGPHTVGVTYGGQVLGAVGSGVAATNVTVTPVSPSAAQSAFAMTASTVTAGASVNATFTARDRYGNAVPCVSPATAPVASVPFTVFLDGHTPTGLAWFCTADSPACFLATWLAPLQPGSYNITASCGGFALNDGPSTLAVLSDTTPPTIAAGSVIFASNNPNGPTRARLGDRLTVRLTASEPLGAATVLIAGHTLVAAQLDQAATEWGASWVVLPSDCAQGGGAGLLKAAVVNATDRASNPLPSGTTPVAAPATVELDCIRPRLSRLTFTSSNALPRVAHPGDRLTVSFTATEPLWVTASSPIVLTIAGHPVNVTAAAPALNAANDADGWTSFEASYQLTGSDRLGPVGFAVLKLADLAANTLEAPLSTPTEGPAVIYFVAETYRCHTDGECQADGDSGARCLAGGLTATTGGSFTRLWECQCSQPGYTVTPPGGTTCSRPAVSAASSGLWVAYVAGPLGSLLLIALLLVMLLLVRRRDRRRKNDPQQNPKTVVSPPSAPASVVRPEAEGEDAGGVNFFGIGTSVPPELPLHATAGTAATAADGPAAPAAPVIPGLAPPRLLRLFFPGIFATQAILCTTAVSLVFFFCSLPDRVFGQDEWKNTRTLKSWR
ncbi:hypothetical protein PAPYR_1728 [Paratrimastix pyriformis]|uniref:IPT/TIG domain-containing protein n=1 Tax=Paratrimastix pyriformis TaxID=342808 RepID=A0ABQ8UR50_9EUKA|nr:hypothetical protein PAPYR_1728 [Paratrimastix pyriformis]